MRIKFATKGASAWKVLALAALFTCMAAAPALAQRIVTFSNFTVQQDAVEDARTGAKGLLLKFDAAFNWTETDFFQRQFDVRYRMEQDGRVVLRDTDVPGYKRSLSTYEGTVKGKPGMLAKGFTLLIPYSAIPLETGQHSVELVFSLANDQGTYTDCHRQKIQFAYTKVQLRTKSEQVFTFRDFVWDFAAKAWGSDVPGMRFTAQVDTKYPPSESADDSYEFYWLLRNGGQVLYDSRGGTGSVGETEKFSPKLVEGKATAEVSMFADYYSVKMDGPGEAEVVFVLLGAEGGPKEIFSQRMPLNVPPQYNFESQEFTLGRLDVTAATRDGVKGLSVSYSAAFKHTGVMRNHQMGNYYFYLAVFDAANKLVIAPERAATLGAGTTQLQDGQLPGPSNTTAAGELFIPLHLLNVPAGKQQLKYALMVSDVNLKTKFPMVGTGTVAIDKPAERQYRVDLEYLEMIDANYDAEVIPVSSRLPELHYSIRVGEDSYYSSEYNRNSLLAIPGGTTLRLSEGDLLQVVLYDTDSGFFNDSDLLGRWTLDYAAKGDSFVYEVKNTGQVVGMRVKVTRVK